jgi:hypothetical protein
MMICDVIGDIVAHTGGVQRVFWLSDTSLVSVGADRSLKLWELPALA